MSWLEYQPPCHRKHVTSIELHAASFFKHNLGKAESATLRSHCSLDDVARYYAARYVVIERKLTIESSRGVTYQILCYSTCYLEISIAVGKGRARAGKVQNAYNWHNQQAIITLSHGS